MKTEREKFVSFFFSFSSGPENGQKGKRKKEDEQKTFDDQSDDCSSGIGGEKNSRPNYYLLVAPRVFGSKWGKRTSHAKDF